MAGIRVGGTAILPPGCSPPFGALEGTDGDGDFHVYKACNGDPAGDATRYDDFNADFYAGIRGATISPDGTQILFEIDNPSNSYFTQIWVTANTPGSTPTLVVTDASNYCWSPAWGPDSDTFVYSKGAGSSYLGGTILLDTVSSPGSPVTLKSSAAGFSPFRPQLNFDGTRVAYNYYNQGTVTGSLRVCDEDGTNDASVDSGVRYRFQGPQFSWAHASNVIAYDDGQTGTNAAYVINDDGSGQVQINANGDAAGASCRVSDRAWPADDSYVVIGSLILFTVYNPVRCELDGSTSTNLNALHGSWNNDYFRQVIVEGNRIWFIEGSLTVASTAIDGSDYQVNLLIDGGAINDFSFGDGWYYG